MNLLRSMLGHLKILALSALMVGPPCSELAAAHQPGARITRTLTIPASLPVIVEASVGDISIEGWDRPEVSIEISRRASSSAELARLDPIIEESSGSLRIAALQADEGTDPTLRSTIEIRAPAATVFEAVRLGEGRIALDNLRGKVTASVRRGPIEASSISGEVRLETGVGDVEVKNARLTPDGTLRLRAFNGNVTLQLAARPADARILAVTLNGSVTSEIPLSMKDRFGPRFGEASLGKGEPLISIDVVTGNIAIRTK